MSHIQATDSLFYNIKETSAKKCKAWLRAHLKKDTKHLEHQEQWTNDLHQESNHISNDATLSGGDFLK